MKSIPVHAVSSRSSVSGTRAPSDRDPFSVPQMESVRQGVDQRLGEGQEKLHQMWLSWNQKTAQDAEKGPAKPEVPAGAPGAPCECPCPVQCKPRLLSPGQPQNP